MVGFPTKKDEEPKKVKAFLAKETEGLSLGLIQAPTEVLGVPGVTSTAIVPAGPMGRCMEIFSGRSLPENDVGQKTEGFKVVFVFVDF